MRGQKHTFWHCVDPLTFGGSGVGHIVPFYFAVEDISYLAFPMSFSFISSSSTLILLWGLSYPTNSSFSRTVTHGSPLSPGQGVGRWHEWGRSVLPWNFDSWTGHVGPSVWCQGVQTWSLSQDSQSVWKSCKPTVLCWWQGGQRIKIHRMPAMPYVLCLSSLS